MGLLRKFMETTRSKRRVEIRHLLRPLYFKSGFLSGTMENLVLVLNPDSDPEKSVWKCINISCMSKLPTLAWCKKTVKDWAGMGASYTGTDHEVVWSGYIGEAKFDLLIETYNKCQQYLSNQ